MSSAPNDLKPNLFRPPYTLFWASRVCSSLGYQIAAVAIGWFVYDKTRSAYDLGFLGLCQFLPVVLLTLASGHLADRFDRRRIVLTCQTFEASVFAALTAAALLHHLSVPIVFAAVTVIGGARAFEGPTLSSLLPGLVPQSVLPRAIALASSAGQTATIVGPSLGGLLYAAGVRLPLAFSAVFLLTASLCIACIRVERPIPAREPVTLKSVFSGVSFVWSRPAILGVISLDLFAVLLGGITALLPIFARSILHAGPWGLGLLRSAPAVGALAMSALLSRRSLRGRVGLKMFAAVIVFGLATVVFAASTHIVLSVAALLVLGASDNVSVVIRTSLVQLSTPDAMRGRVNAINSLFIGTSNQLGEFESGITAGLLGPVVAGIVGGVGTILVALAWMRLFPGLRSLDSLTDAEPDLVKSG